MQEQGYYRKRDREGRAYECPAFTLHEIGTQRAEEGHGGQNGHDGRSGDQAR